MNNNNPEILTKLSLLPNFEHTKVLKVNCLQYPEGVSSDEVELHCLLKLRYLTILEVSVKEIADSSKMEYSLSLGKFVKVLKNEISELQLLRYWKGNIDSQSAIDIFTSLQHNTSLKELDLSQNRQLAVGDSEAVGCAIEKMLNVNRTLKTLNLIDCRLDTTVITDIAAGLAHNASLGELNIEGDIFSINDITSEGWGYICSRHSVTPH